LPTYHSSSVAHPAAFCAAPIFLSTRFTCANSTMQRSNAASRASRCAGSAAPILYWEFTFAVHACAQYSSSANTSRSSPLTVWSHREHWITTPYERAVLHVLLGWTLREMADAYVHEQPALEAMLPMYQRVDPTAQGSGGSGGVAAPVHVHVPWTPQVLVFRDFSEADEVIMKRATGSGRVGSDRFLLHNITYLG
ncbi:hypothetical protein GGX14DRAFT_661667, partial [Mycena pura]